MTSTLTLDEIKTRIRKAFPTYPTVVESYDGEARIRFQVKHPQEGAPPLHTEDECLVRLCRDQTYLDGLLSAVREKVGARAAAYQRASA